MSSSSNNGPEQPSDNTQGGLADIDARGDAAAYENLASTTNSTNNGGSAAATCSEESDASADGRSTKERLAILVILLELVALTFQVLLRLLEFITQYILPLVRILVQIFRVMAVVAPGISAEEE
jgi:hypothetical protein